MKDSNCIFCKLANGEIPTNAIYEDEEFKAILDASPATRGHALILPKNHYANVYGIDSEVLGKAAKLAQKYEVPMPIVDEINKVLFEGKDPKQAVDDLMLRESKIENSSLLWEE